MSDNYSTGTVTDVIPMLCIWTESRNWISILVVRIILNTKSPHYFKHDPGRSVRIFLNNKSPHSFKHGPHFFKQVRIFFKRGPHFFKHGPHFFKHGPHFFKQEVRIFFKHKVRILVLAHLRYTVKSRFFYLFQTIFHFESVSSKRENEAQFSKNDEKAFGK